jgi:large subunit ribosomal protein L2
VKVGEILKTGADIEIKPGNTMPLRNVPPGLFVHNIEITPKKGGQIARGAGTYAQIAAREGDFVQLKLPSGEVRKFRGECMATIGVVGNNDHENISLGKAGRSRWLGIRPQSRAIAMNPVDHPMGGGEGRSKSGGGRQHPVSPWGQPAKGFKTRKRHKESEKYIVTHRKK